MSVPLFNNIGNLEPKGRYAALAFGCLPLPIIFGVGAGMKRKAGYDAASGVVGRPARWAFALVWAILSVAWTFAALVLTVHMNQWALLAWSIGSVLAMALAVMWMVFYNAGKRAVAQQMLYAFAFVASLMLLSAATAPQDPANASLWEPYAVAIALAPLAVWPLLASTLGLLDANLASGGSKQK